MERQTVFVGISTIILAASLGFIAGLEVFSVQESSLYSSDTNITLNEQEYNQTVNFDGKEVNFFFEPWTSQAFIEREDAPTIDIDLEEGEHRESQVVTLGQESYRIYFNYVHNSENSLTIYRIQQL